MRRFFWFDSARAKTIPHVSPEPVVGPFQLDHGDGHDESPPFPTAAVRIRAVKVGLRAEAGLSELIRF